MKKILLTLGIMGLVFGGVSFAADKEEVSKYVTCNYKDNQKIKKYKYINTKTFKKIDNYISKDKNNIYFCKNQSVLKGADAKTFKTILTGLLRKDKNNIYILSSSRGGAGGMGENIDYYNKNEQIGAYGILSYTRMSHSAGGDVNKIINYDYFKDNFSGTNKNTTGSYKYNFPGRDPRIFGFGTGILDGSGYWVNYIQKQ